MYYAYFPYRKRGNRGLQHQMRLSISEWAGVSENDAVQCLAKVPKSSSYQVNILISSSATP